MKKRKLLSTITVNLRLKTFKKVMQASNQIKTNHKRRRMEREEYFVWDNLSKKLKLMTFQI
jgi:hypothetical protein